MAAKAAIHDKLQRTQYCGCKEVSRHCLRFNAKDSVLRFVVDGRLRGHDDERAYLL